MEYIVQGKGFIGVMSEPEYVGEMAPRQDTAAVAHACEQPGALHFFGNDGQCIFCHGHRDPPKS